MSSWGTRAYYSETSSSFFFNPTDRPTQYQETCSTVNEEKMDGLRGNQTSMFQLGGGSCNFQPCFRGGSVIFVPKEGDGSCVFYQPHFQMLRSPPPPTPLYVLTSSLYKPKRRVSKFTFLKRAQTE